MNEIRQNVNLLPKREGNGAHLTNLLAIDSAKRSEAKKGFRSLL